MPVLSPVHEVQGLALLLSPEHACRSDTLNMTLMGLIVRNLWRTGRVLEKFRDEGLISPNDWHSLLEKDTSRNHSATVKRMDDQLVKNSIMHENNDYYSYDWLDKGPVGYVCIDRGFEILEAADKEFTDNLVQGKLIPRQDDDAYGLLLRLNMARFVLKGSDEGKIFHDFCARIGSDKGLGPSSYPEDTDIHFHNRPWDYGYALLNVAHVLNENRKEKDFDSLAGKLTDFFRARMDKLFTKGIYFEEPHFTGSTYQYSSDGSEGEFARREVSVTTTTSTEQSYSEAISESLTTGFGFGKEGFSFGADVSVEFSQEWSTTTGSAVETSTGDWESIARTSQLASYNEGRLSVAVAIVAEINDRFGNFILDDDDSRHFFRGDIPYTGEYMLVTHLSGKENIPSNELMEKDDGYVDFRSAIFKEFVEVLFSMTGRSALYYGNGRKPHEWRRMVVPRGEHRNIVFRDTAVSKLSFSEVNTSCKHGLQMICAYELHHRKSNRTLPAVIGPYSCWTETGGNTPVIVADEVANAAVLACSGVPFKQEGGMLKHLGSREFDSYTPEGYMHFVEGDRLTYGSDQPVRDPVLAFEVGHSVVTEGTTK